MCGREEEEMSARTGANVFFCKQGLCDLKNQLTNQSQRPLTAGTDFFKLHFIVIKKFIGV